MKLRNAIEIKKKLLIRDENGVWMKPHHLFLNGFNRMRTGGLLGQEAAGSEGPLFVSTVWGIYALHVVIPFSHFHL